MAAPSEFVFPGQHDVGAAVQRLQDALGAHPGPAGSLDRVLLDTFDGRLRKAGLAAERPARGAAPAPAADVLRAAGERALLPVARVRSATRELAVLDAEGKTTVRLTLERPEVVTDEGRAIALDVRLRARGVRGYDAELAQALAALEGAGDVAAPRRSLFDEASRAMGRRPAGTSTKVKVALEPGMRSDAAASALLHRLADVAVVTLPGTLDDLDPEFLHDFRVAVRRTRSVLRELKPVFDPERLEEVRAELKWLQAVTGPVRDLDVQLLDWEELVAGLDAERREELEALHAMLAADRARELRGLRRALRGTRCSGALAGWRALAADPGDGQEAGTPIEALAARRIGAVHRHMVRDGRAIGEDSPPQALHDLRKRGKELRYLLELFGALFPGEVVDPLVATLKDLQDVLGRFQDRAVQAGLLEAAGRRLVEQDPGHTRAVMALGLLAEGLQADQRAARAEFGERFAAFAAKDQRRLVKATFA